MSSSTSPTASDWESTEPSDTSSSGMGCGLSDGEWKLVFLVRNAAVAAAVDPSDEQAAVALAAAESTLRKRGRRRKEQKVAAAASNFEVATMWVAKRVAARERRRRRRMRRCKAASTTCDALTRRMPAAAAEASPTNSVVGEGARSFDTIGWVAACALLYPTSTGAANAAVGTGLLPPVPRATPLRVQNPVVYVPGTGRASSLFLQRMNTMKFKVEPMAPTLSSPEAIAKNLTGFTVKVEPGAHVKVEKDENVIGGGGKWGGGGGGPAWYEQERGRGDPDEVARREALRTMVYGRQSIAAPSSPPTPNWWPLPAGANAPPPPAGGGSPPRRLPTDILALLSTSTSPCGYCGHPTPSFRASGFVAHRLAPSTYNDLLDAGYRRSGTYVYKLANDVTCCQHLVIRLEATHFAPSRSQRKRQAKLRRLLASGEGVGGVPPLSGRRRRGEEGAGGGGRARALAPMAEARQMPRAPPQMLRAENVPDDGGQTRAMATRR
ncbi:hypothetical protein BU14_0148s0026 [Porphyra umbilicalis]|uniref:N-end aminoacyl transferase N-terminal domain-containing protein n=1 Tax=Porphyra umbilicalis TaxID=2786 RepID=A0A1X6P9K7_PORUM|nr:hypothetical protein BU14_0148s0026 [Porphyra umbilicalis]|eukprot:OSX77450.1 hypothetical protein BU14_0148s0026 [Porphyra umbilicalis]